VDLRQVVEQSHGALDKFAQGEGQAFKSLCSHRNDITLANPFGPVARGWTQVGEALDYASSRFRDGTVTRIETIAAYETADLATILEIEYWKARVGGGEQVEPFVLRVTTTFRREDDDWKIVHRHADPLATFDPNGPVRQTLR